MTEEKGITGRYERESIHNPYRKNEKENKYT
jgi:hypothetical protein